MLEKAISIYGETIKTLKIGYTTEIRSKVAGKLRETAGLREGGWLLDGIINQIKA